MDPKEAPEDDDEAEASLALYRNLLGTPTMHTYPEQYRTQPI